MSPETGGSVTPVKNGPSVLLEIGTEEIPSRFLPGAISDLEKISEQVFNDYRLAYGKISVFATPRRLAVIIDGVAPGQKDQVREVFGPSRKAAFDAGGKPTKAATGFAGSLGISVSDIRIKTKGKGEYIVAMIEEKGLETEKVLPEALKKIILSLRFPKSMRWGDRNLSFVRPIQWILAMYGSRKVECEIDGVRSGTMTRGHRFLSPASFRIKEISSYMKLLENNFVILDHEKRAKIIREGMTGLFGSPDRQPLIDEELLDTVNFIVEFPVPVLCNFGSEYLRLPKELLITVMKDHQKYFAVQDSSGNLLNHFVVISNTRKENAETVRIGAERVIKARFDDAQFYYREDTATALFDRVNELKGVTFHDKLGTLFDKTERIRYLAGVLSEKISPGLYEKNVRAASLSKTDLVTGVVREFPELQGVMAKYYALHDGEDRSVAEALEEQYLPKYFGDNLPRSDSGAILSLSDKIDNVSSFFSIGQIPTGSEDPFALRRQAMGIISIILDRSYAIPLRDMFSSALKIISKNLNITSTDADLENIVAFMEHRIEFILSSRGHAQDAIRAVLSISTIHPLQAVLARIDSLVQFRREDLFPDFLLAIKRIHNILPKEPLPRMNADLLAEKEEINLHNTFIALRDRTISSIEAGRIYDGLKEFAEITGPVNTFFDNVLVMDKREEIKANRLALLREIWATASLIADFSRLQ